MYQVILTRSAQKSLRKIPKQYLERIKKSTALLAFNPYSGKKLEGHYEDNYSIRVWPYRIIYSINKKQLIVSVIEIEHRGQAYRK